jgi:hypothetical protein
VTGDWRKLRNEQLRDLHVSTVVKNKNKMGETCSSHGENRHTYTVWWLNLKVRRHLDETFVEGRIILKWILKD